MMPHLTPYSHRRPSSVSPYHVSLTVAYGKKKEVFAMVIDVEVEALRWAQVEDMRLPDGLEGGYLFTRELIVLDDRLTDIQRRCVLAHEISHARHRDQGCDCDDCIETRANTEAAILLVDLTAYRRAEMMSDNPVWIARELEVLPWVVLAYRRWLSDNGQTPEYSWEWGC